MQPVVFEEEKFERRFDAGLWRGIIGLLRPHWAGYLLIIFTMALLGAVDVAMPLLTRRAIDRGIVPGDTDELFRAVVLYVLLIAAQAVLVAAFIALSGRIGARVMEGLRRRLFAHLQRLSLSYFDRTPAGWILSRLLSDCERVGETLTWGGVDLFWSIAMMSVMAVTMVVVEWRLAVAALTLLPIIIVVSLKFQRPILQRAREARKLNSDITARFSESVNGLRVIKSLSQEEPESRAFGQLADAMFTASFRSAVLSSLYLPVIQLVGAAASALVVALGGSGVIAGSFTLGTLVAFVSFSRRFYIPAAEIARVFGDLQQTQAAAERVFSLLSIKPEITDRPRAKPGPPITGLVEFRQVCFSYNGKDKILNRFSLKVRPGQMIALVGPTGGGKTTVISLLARFYDPTAGAVLIDGIDIRNRPLQTLRSQLGVVLQNPHLFSGTIRDNIRYGRLDADEQEIAAAAALTGAHQFITELPGGYDTELQEGGAPLSTGQKQLLALSRAVLARPALFIMDEATSAIDQETEHKIQQAIETVLHGRTSFVVAHRLSTIRQADRILVIEDGAIAESGTHDELLQKKGRYYRLYTMNMLGLLSSDAA